MSDEISVKNNCSCLEQWEAELAQQENVTGFVCGCFGLNCLSREGKPSALGIVHFSASVYDIKDHSFVLLLLAASSLALLWFL